MCWSTIVGPRRLSVTCRPLDVRYASACRLCSRPTSNEHHDKLKHIGHNLANAGGSTWQQQVRILPRPKNLWAGSLAKCCRQKRGAWCLERCALIVWVRTGFKSNVFSSAHEQSTKHQVPSTRLRVNAERTTSPTRAMWSLITPAMEASCSTVFSILSPSKARSLML